MLRLRTNLRKKEQKLNKTLKIKKKIGKSKSLKYLWKIKKIQNIVKRKRKNEKKNKKRK